MSSSSSITMKHDNSSYHIQRLMKTAAQRNNIIHLFAKTLSHYGAKHKDVEAAMNKKNVTDNELLVGIRSLCRFPDITDGKEKNVYRASSKVRDIRGMLREYSILLQVTPSSKYLDVGHGDGVITRAIGVEFNFREKHVYGIDIPEWMGQQHALTSPSHKNPNFIYRNADENPKFDMFDTGTFQLVTCLMSIHHFSTHSREVRLNEIVRVLETDGVLVIREHHGDSDDMNTIIDLEHALHFITLEKNDPSEFWKDYVGNYVPESVLQKELRDRGLEFVGVYHQYDRKTRDWTAVYSKPTNAYWSLFKKH